MMNNAPEKWQVGQRVMWIRDSSDSWGPSAGETGVVVELSKECENRAGYEYQVFWCRPDSYRDKIARFWTTPDDVRIITEQE